MKRIAIAFLRLLKNFVCDKICLPNVAEFARKHDIFSPIDEWNLTFNQAFRQGVRAKGAYVHLFHNC